MSTLARSASTTSFPSQWIATGATAPNASAGTVFSAANLTVTSAAADRETAPTIVTSAVIMAVAGLGAAAATVAARTGPRPRGQPTLPTGHPTTRVGGMAEEIIQNHPVPEMASALVRNKNDDQVKCI